MVKQSAGLLMFRLRGGAVELLLGHPGGPFFRRKDHGSWTLPKGLLEDEVEDPLAAARREFEEETGLRVGAADFLELGEVRLGSGKRVRAWAFEGDCDPETLESNTFEMEWPPRSGRRQEFPELDRFAFFDPEEAVERLNPKQSAFVQRLLEVLAERGRSP
ncbi:MAG: NUDIX domain-containing protein [Acidobacteriota bacterium]